MSAQWVSRLPVAAIGSLLFSSTACNRLLGIHEYVTVGVDSGVDSGVGGPGSGGTGARNDAAVVGDGSNGGPRMHVGFDAVQRPSATDLQQQWGVAKHRSAVSECLHGWDVQWAVCQGHEEM